MRETGRGDLAQPAYYTVPTDGIRVPAAFFAQGWLWALSNSEIATYLMFRHLARAHPDTHAGDGIYIYGGRPRARVRARAGRIRGPHSARAVLAGLRPSPTRRAGVGAGSRRDLRSGWSTATTRYAKGFDL